MKLITYAEAANKLSVSVQMIKQAMSAERGVFTRAGHRGNSVLIPEEQVLLFLGNNPRTGKKKRLSLNALSSEERTLWHKYEKEAMKPTSLQDKEEVEKIVFEGLAALKNDVTSEIVASLMSALNTLLSRGRESETSNPKRIAVV